MSGARAAVRCSRWRQETRRKPHHTLASPPREVFALRAPHMIHAGPSRLLRAWRPAGLADLRARNAAGLNVEPAAAFRSAGISAIDSKIKIAFQKT